MSKSTIIPDRYDKQTIQGIVDRLSALEKGTYKRGEDVLIGLPQAAASQSTRVPRLILVSPSTGQQWSVEVDSLGSLVVTAL